MAASTDFTTQIVQDLGATPTPETLVDVVPVNE
jgi:hypothetical protein